jgi:hypothetical protein
MLEKVIHQISEFYLKNVQNPKMVAVDGENPST